MRRAAAFALWALLANSLGGCAAWHRPLAVAPRTPTGAIQPRPSESQALREALKAMPARSTRPPLGNFLPPIAESAAQARALRLSLALLRERGGLRVSDALRPRSSAEFLAFARSAVAAQSTWWTLEVREGAEGGFEVLAAQGERSWRSGWVELAPPSSAEELAPFTESTLHGRLGGLDVEALLLVDGRPHVGSSQGVAEIAVRDGSLTLKAARRQERRKVQLAPSVHSLGVEQSASDPLLSWSFDCGAWFVDGVRFSEPVPTQFGQLLAWPQRPGEWLLYLPSRRELQWHVQALRLSSALPARHRTAAAPLPLAQGELSVQLSPWYQLRERHALAQFALDRRSAEPTEDWRIARRSEGVWSIERRWAASAVQAQVVAAALNAQWAAAPDWLRAGAELELEARPDGVELRCTPSLPDLLERLALPELWLPLPGSPSSQPTTWQLQADSTAAVLRLGAAWSLHSRCDWRGDRIGVVLLPAPSTAAPLRQLLREALIGRELLSAPADWAAQTPIGRAALAPVQSRASTAQRGTLYVHLQRGCLPFTEIDRLVRRLSALLQRHGIGVTQVQDWHALRLGTGDAVARIEALSLYAGEPLLRASELMARAQLPGNVEPSLIRQPVGSPQREAAALALEQSWLEEGWLLPLWSLPLHLESAVSIVGVGAARVGMPAIPWLARRAPCAP